MARVEKATLNLRYDFTPDELAAMSLIMARTYQEKDALEDQKKAVMAQIKSDIDFKTAELSKITNKLNNRYEYRNVDCEWVYDVPERGQKRLVRLDTGEVVREEYMTDEDRQGEMFA